MLAAAVLVTLKHALTPWRTIASRPRPAACQGMPEGHEAFFRYLTNLRTLELGATQTTQKQLPGRRGWQRRRRLQQGSRPLLQALHTAAACLNASCACPLPTHATASARAEDWAVWDLPRDYAPLRAMPHLSRLTLNIVEELETNMPALLTLTQVRGGSLHCALLGCTQAARVCCMAGTGAGHAGGASLPIKELLWWLGLDALAHGSCDCARVLVSAAVLAHAAGACRTAPLHWRCAGCRAVAARMLQGQPWPGAAAQPRAA